jgi:hypothetical protein
VFCALHRPISTTHKQQLKKRKIRPEKNKEIAPQRRRTSTAAAAAL